MPSLTFQKYLLINSFITLVFITGVFVFGANNFWVTAQLSAAGIIYLFLLLLAKSEIKKLRYPTIFFGYLLALLLPFGHVLLEFSNNRNLALLLYIISSGYFGTLFLLKEESQL